MFSTDFSKLKKSSFTFKDKSECQFLIASFEKDTKQVSLATGEEVTADVLKVKCTATENNTKENPEMVGKDITLYLAFMDKNGNCPSTTFDFLQAMYGDSLTDGSFSPDRFAELVGMVFTCVSRLSEYQGKTYQNWQGFRDFKDAASVGDFS